MKTYKLSMAIALILGGALASGAAFAAPPPGAGGGGGGGGSGGKPSSEAAQNLSVPAILVGSLGTLVCGANDLAPSALVPPTGTPLTGYELPGDWWVQKVHAWQAQCFTATSALVFGAWGDNLTGDAKLKASSPIRVEIVLTNRTDFGGELTMQGYNVLKLQPSTLDRLSAYGHDALLDGVWTATADTFSEGEWVVHDAGMQLSVQNLDTGDFVKQLEPIAPEINATGKIVYGYNLRVAEAGNYQIHFKTSSAVTFTSCDAGVCAPGGSDAYLDIVVIGGGGGAGGGGAGGGGKPF